MPIGPLEVGLIVLALLFVFGAGQLSKVGGAVGKSIRDFRREVTTVDRSAKTEP